MVCESAAVRSDGNSTHHIQKRAAGDQEKKPFVIQMREKYNVSVFTGPDYPAIFAIFAGEYSSAERLSRRIFHSIVSFACTPFI